MAYILIRFLVSVASACATDVVEMRGEWGSAKFRVEVADTPEERNRGLMFRDSLSPLSGMLFLFERPGPATFWMKNTSIPLDIVFVDELGVVQHIHANARPGSVAPIRGGDEILAVLEINAGTADRLGLEVGSQLRHPGLPQPKALWACD